MVLTQSMNQVYTGSFWMGAFRGATAKRHRLWSNCKDLLNEVVRRGELAWICLSSFAFNESTFFHNSFFASCTRQADIFPEKPFAHFLELLMDLFVNIMTKKVVVVMQGLQRSLKAARVLASDCGCTQGLGAHNFVQLDLCRAKELYGWVWRMHCGCGNDPIAGQISWDLLMDLALCVCAVKELSLECGFQTLGVPKHNFLTLVFFLKNPRVRKWWFKKGLEPHWFGNPHSSKICLVVHI